MERISKRRRSKVKKSEHDDVLMSESKKSKLDDVNAYGYVTNETCSNGNKGKEDKEDNKGDVSESNPKELVCNDVDVFIEA